MEIYFLRHGDAGPGSGDERPLTPEGAAAMEREASGLSRLALPVELILTSPVARALQTARIAARRLSLEDVLRVEPRLAPGFGVDELSGILEDHRDRRSLLLVGHEPDFSTVVSACIGGGSVEIKKGTVARVDFESPAAPRGVLAWLVPARLLAGEA